MRQLLLAFYGDDFTGSADVMEVLQWSGLRSVLFLDAPTTEQLDEFEGLRAFGVAGWSRTMSPSEMDAELKAVFQQLKDSGAPIVHYKTCSTFDSSPEIGSIGRALELGREVFGESVVPMVIGAPNLARYQAFGNLFASSGLDTEPFRLDQHPTMRQHPITPMAEADLRMHLKQQTSLKVDLCDVLQLNRTGFEDEFACTANQCAALLFDVLYPEHLPKIGAAIHRMVAGDSPKFALGSSGVEYALTEYWSDTDRLAGLQSHSAGRPTFGPTEQLLVITGSCSPVNDRQIAWAERIGFETIALDPAELIAPASREHEIAQSIEEALKRLRQGANVILHSSRGPRDPRVAETQTAFRKLGFSDLDIKLKSGRTLGPLLGRILRGILQKYRLPRVAVAGGDTSGYVARQLGITALEAIAPVAPGSPLCRVHADQDIDGMEIFFKGGQVGKDDVWATMLNGTRE